MSATSINTKITAAVAAQESGDYESALSYLRSAKMLLAALPDSVHEERELTWDRTAIDAAIRDLEMLRGATSGIRRTTVTYAATDADDES